jgi:chromosome segregation protein
MRLKRLDLYGYKSFASRHSVEFGEGITAIVGPNGSGKSNIADAVRWVMGEQRFRHLRAKTTDDLIFAGTRQRARMGVAEVIITLDNSTGWLPIDYAEVSVGRRAYRSGENEYIINGNVVRYRDVVDMLGVAGLARSTYTVIGQGMVDAALSLRPEERRELFEEAAGITPHLRKREQALRRIDETRRNLERVSDILSEIQPRANRLRRQSERAEEHGLLRQDLQELQRILYGHQWQRLQRDLFNAEEQVRTKQIQFDAQRAYTRTFGDKQEQLTEQQTAGRRELARLRQEETAKREALERLRREAAIMAERREMLQQQVQMLGAERETLESRYEILKGEAASALQELAQQEQALQESVAALSEARAAMTEVDAVRRQVQDRNKQVRNQAQRLDAKHTQLTARLEQLGERREQLVVEQKKAQEQLTTLQQRLQALVQKEDELTQREQVCGQGLAEAQAHQREIEGNTTRLREEMVQIGRELTRIETDRDRLVARRDALERLREEMTGYHPGVRAVLSASARLEGILGTVASLIRVPQKVEAAIEAALGSRLQNVVTERWEHAEAAIALLKERRAGWATFLPLDTLRPSRPLQIDPAADVLGVASELVRYEERLRPVIELLLGRTVVVRDLAAARRLLRGRNRAALIVTVEGETVQPSGALSGGSRQRSTPLLAQEREWRALPQRIAEVEDALERAAQSSSELDEQLAELQRQTNATRAEEQRLRQEQGAAREALAAHRRHRQELERERDWLTSRLKQAQEQLTTLDRSEAQMNTELEAVVQQRHAVATQLDALQEQLAAADDRELRQRVSDLETRHAVAERTVSSQRRLVASHRSNLNGVHDQIAAKGEQRAGVERDLAVLINSRETTIAQRTQAEQDLASVCQRMIPAEQALATIEDAQRDLERQRNESLERLQEAEIALSQATLERDRLVDRQANLSREIESELGPISLPQTVSHQLRLDLGDDVVELPRVASLPPGIHEEIRQLKTRLRRLGSINPDAPHEYEQLLERQTFLQSQAGDLRGAIASIYEVIEELDAVIERDFVATVERVDSAFRHYFSILFSGGSARLVLTDRDDPSTSGIEIEANPPGKRAQSLALLSGGERALTAVALIFALLDANPVPFCFLDEVDAALDESNVGRFRELLQQHAQDTQFVVITHNRSTIEAAATLYGVSMAEQGVSQMVSLKLDGQRTVVAKADESDYLALP